MGRFCRICGRHRPHESFGGRGERAIVCKSCRRKPREQRRRVLLMDEIAGFLEQSNISAKNIRRLEKLESETIEDVATFAALVRRIAQVAPRKRKRWTRLRQQRRELFRLAAEAGIMDDLEPQQWDEYADSELDEGTDFEQADLDGWIEPRPYEHEPTAEELRLAYSDDILF